MNKFKLFEEFSDDQMAYEVHDELDGDSLKRIKRSPLTKKLLKSVEGSITEDHTEVYLCFTTREILEYEYIFTPNHHDGAKFHIRIDNKFVDDTRDKERFFSDMLPSYNSVIVALTHFYFEWKLGILNDTTEQKNALKKKFIASTKTIEEFFHEVRGTLGGKKYGF